MHGIAPVSLDLIAWLLGKEGRGDDPTDESLFREVPIEPVAARPGLIDEDQLSAFGMELADELIDVTLAGSDGCPPQESGSCRFIATRAAMGSSEGPFGLSPSFRTEQ